MPASRKLTLGVPRLSTTLDELSTWIDVHTGTPRLFAEHVRDYRHYSDIVNATHAKSDVRQAVHARLDAFIGNGSAIVNAQRITVRHIGAGERAAVRSETIKRHHPGLWEASRATVTSLSIIDTTAEPLDVVAPRMMTVPQAWAALEAVKARNSEAAAAVKPAREGINDTLDALVDEWDGSQRVTADGWIVGRKSSLRFDETLCKALAPTHNVDLEPLMTTSHYAGRLSYVLLADESLIELDGD